MNSAPPWPWAVAEAVLAARDPDHKVALTREAAHLWLCLPPPATTDPLAGIGPEGVADLPPPGAPERPLLVSPHRVAKRTRGPRGRAAHLHALAHIEFVAINLAWDAVCRFRGLPWAFYRDWVQVALEEADHFVRLRQRLREQGHDYGDFDAHNGLWQMAEKTAHDPLLRMALVPRYLEARALDAVPLMAAKFRQGGDEASAALLESIGADEVGHVAAGSRWLAAFCRQRGRDPIRAWREIITAQPGLRVKGPLNREARQAAGFSPAELAWLASQAE